LEIGEVTKKTILFTYTSKIQKKSLSKFCVVCVQFIDQAGVAVNGYPPFTGPQWGTFNSMFLIHIRLIELNL